MKTKSVLYEEARNKIGGVVASKNRYGNFFRSKVTPHNPKTQAQTDVRAKFTTNSQAWRTLTDIERAGWVALALQVTYTDPLGTRYHPTGQQLFVGCNANLANTQQAGILIAPGAPEPPAEISDLALTATIMTAAPHTQTMGLTGAGGSATDGYIIKATAPFSAGRSFISPSQYRLLVGGVGSDTLPLGIGPLYNDKFGNLTVGAKLAVSVTAISPTGFAGPVLAETIVVSAV